MKMKYILPIAVLILALCGMACAESVPEDVLHDAILTLSWDNTDGEFWTEGHVVLGEEITDGKAVVYADVMCQKYGFMAGIFTDCGGGFQSPLKLIFEISGDDYILKEIQRPEDGTEYWPSIEAMMPKSAIDKLTADSEGNRKEIGRQMHAQAEYYVRSIGRTERVGDWRDLDLQLSGILVTASNLTTGFSPPYPLWVTEIEKLEDGERYVYHRTWAPNDDLTEHVFITPDGGTLFCNGTTGTLTLLKTKKADGEVIERITIRADLAELFVTYEDAYGTKEHHFLFDGLEYHQPTLTETGECRVSYESFEYHNQFLAE